MRIVVVSGTPIAKEIGRTTKGKLKISENPCKGKLPYPRELKLKKLRVFSHNATL
jgi:hypothetical protein